MFEFYNVLTIIGAFILVFALLSLFIKEKCYISETLVATVVGMVFGKNGFRGINLSDKAAAVGMFQFSRMVINLQVIAVGMVVSKEYVLKSVQSLFMLLVPTMMFSWIVSTIIIRYFLEFSLENAMIVGACITPTDPVLASTILKGKFANRYVPAHIRKLLTFESGANDGLGLALLNFPLYLLIYRGRPADIAWSLFFKTFIYELGLSVVIGIGLGVLSRYLLIKSKEMRMIDKESLLAYTIALAFFVSGVTALMGVDDIFACFVCGVFFSWYDEESIEEVKESHLLEVIDMLVNLTFFVFFGATFPYEAISAQNIFVCVMLILLRRLPVILVLKPAIDKLYTVKEAVFAGWFGPVGAGAIFLAYSAKEMLQEHKISLDGKIMNLVHLIVFSSVLIHGITVPVIHIHLRNKVKKAPKQLYEYSEYSETEYMAPMPKYPALHSESTF